jgi:parvulin-like peptidyl-prolyl isomerase
MTETLSYSDQEIIDFLKLSGQISAVLEAIAARNVIIAAAKAEGLEVSDEELQQGADQIRLNNQLLQASDTFIWLQKQGLTEDDFEEMVRHTVLSLKLTEHLFANKVESIFAERQIDYTQVALYEVVLDDEDLALELYYAIKEGELSFHEMAKQYCADKELGRKGGYRGLVSRMELQAEVRAAVFASAPPQLLKPILSKQGVHLIHAEEIVQPKLTPILHQQISSELFLEWIKIKLSNGES